MDIHNMTLCSLLRQIFVSSFSDALLTAEVW